MERELVDWLQKTLPGGAHVELGLGDDAAVLRPFGDARLVVTTDSLGDGTHFLMNEVEPRWIGHKCLAASLSDLAAMAAEPVAVFVSLMLPRGANDPLALAKELFAGMTRLAEEFATPIAGGDTNVWDGPLTVSVTAIGRLGERGPLLRGAAQPGDAILVTGELGGSITGRHLDFTPRVREALVLHQRYNLHAGMDITDGLALDLSRLCEASGLGAVLEAQAIPISPAAEQLAQADGSDALHHALSDGEDFELLMTAPYKVAEQMVTDQPVGCGIAIIGKIIAEPGLFLASPGVAPQPLKPSGYLHQ